MIGQKKTFIWAGGEHEFCFAIGELRALEQRRNVGIGTLQKRMMVGDFYVDDVIDILRIGLQGAGMERGEAMRTIETAYGTANYLDLAVFSMLLLTTFISWKTGEEEGDDPTMGESSGETAKRSPSPTVSPDGQPISASAPP
jgi:hypothetical protein